MYYLIGLTQTVGMDSVLRILSAMLCSNTNYSERMLMLMLFIHIIWYTEQCSNIIKITEIIPQSCLYATTIKLFVAL